MNWPNRRHTYLARNLRNNATDVERMLWQAIRNRQIEGVRFNRQVNIGPYICDFVARSVGLIVEVDGGQHAANADRDEERTRWLCAQGYALLRFWNHDLMDNLEGVVEAIRAKLLALPQPLPQAGGEQQAAPTPRDPPASGRGRK